MFIKKSILQIIVAGVVTIVNAANADADAAPTTRGLRAESLESRDVPPVANVSAYVTIDMIEAFKESLLPSNSNLNNNGDGDDSMRAESLEKLESMVNNTTSISIIEDELSSLIEADYHDDVLSFTQSLSPIHDSMHGSCVKANDDTELGMYINSSPDGQVRLCPGIVNFYDEIELTTSITLSCAGPKGSCILDGNEATRHFFSNSADLTFTFIGLVLINGLAKDSSTSGPFGGSVFLVSGSTIIIDGSLFYNNRATSSIGFPVSII